MANPNIIQFSLPELDRQKLQSLAVDGETSLNLTAKRLLNSILNGVDLEIPDNAAKALGDRLSALEKSQSNPATIPDDIGDRLSDLERRAKITAQSLDPLEGKYDDLLAKVSLQDSLQRQVSKLEKRLTQAEKLINNQSGLVADLSKDVVSVLSKDNPDNSQPEIDVMVGKKRGRK